MNFFTTTVFTNNHRQASILQRFSIAFILYVIAFLVGWLALENNFGRISKTRFLISSACIFLGLGVFYGLIRSGFSQRFKDDSMAFQQILFGLLAITYILNVFVIEVRGMILNAYMLGVLFGIFQLSKKQFIIIGLVPVLAYSIIIINDMNSQVEINLRVEIFQLLMLIIFIAIFAYVGNYLSVLRKKLQENRSGLIESHKQLTKKNEELEMIQRELESALNQLGQLAVTDELTGLFNRRQFTATLNKQIENAKKAARPFGLLLIDIDHFKKINDTYGHLAGDEILKKFSEVSKLCLRDSDFMARYGGEEFVVLLPNVTMEILMECSERIRSCVNTISLDNTDKGKTITVSIGATHYHLSEPSEEVMARADAALYLAKEQGRNRVVYNAW